MFELDKWQEIWSTVRKNKLRTFLTGFSVAWGIFMLIILLGAGKGLKTVSKRSSRAVPITACGSAAALQSMKYKGLKTGREITFTNEDYKYLKSTVHGHEFISARLFSRQQTCFL